jgi:hypothetical protein
MTATTAAPARELQRMSRGTTWNPETRTAQVVLSTDGDIGDGVRLIHTREAIRWPSRPIPLVTDHARSVDRVAGAVTALRLEAIDGRQALVGRIELDGPAAGLVEPLIRTGAARFSVGARIHRFEAARAGGGPDKATDWEPFELSAVVAPADGAAVVRSLSHTPEAPMTATTAPAAAEPLEVQRTAAEIKRENRILRAAQGAGLNADETDELLRSDLSADRAVVRVIEIMRDRQVGTRAGHPVLQATMDQLHRGDRAQDLSDVLERKLSGDDSDGDLCNVLRDVLAISETNNTRLLNRAFSTSDFPTALADSTERVLLNAYEESPEGVRSLALSRELSDFRAVKMLRVSQFGAVSKVLEGGEYQAKTFSEEDSGTLQAAQYGGIAVLTRVALANDDLGIFGRLLTEMGRAAARKEAAELAARLADITWNASNSLSGQGNLDIDAIAAAVLLLRRQEDVDGNPVAFSPDVLVIAPEQEKEARQMLGTYQPNTAGEVNPYSTLRLEVDHHLVGGVAYLADTRYQPLGIGRVGNGPSLTVEEEFKTGNINYKVAHDFGTCALDGRSIVKIAL